MMENSNLNPETLTELDLLILKSTAFQVEAFARLSNTPGKVLAIKENHSQTSLQSLPADAKHHIILIKNPNLAYGDSTGIYKWPELGANPYDENNPDNISLPETFTSNDGRLIRVPGDINTDVLQQLSEAVQKGLRRPSLSEIFETTGGKEWWLKDGGKMPLWIDPTPGSESTTRLRNRIVETGLFLEIKELINKHEKR
jgi:hypothetical protein